MPSAALLVLHSLADGTAREIHQIERRIGLDARQIRDALSLLREAGLEIAEHGDTLGLARPFEMLDSVSINRHLAESGATSALTLVPICASTNQSLLAMARSGAPSGTALACEWQTDGRGRRGRAWSAPIGASLAVSLLWRFPQSAEVLAGLPLAVGVGLARALEGLGASGIALKWPNDLLHRGGKLGGVLIETTSTQDRETAAVIGFGINVDLSGAARRSIAGGNRAQNGDGEPPALPAADLAGSLLPRPSRSKILAHILVELDRCLVAFSLRGFGCFRRAWLSRHAFHGREVTVVQHPGRTVTGRAVNVGEDGALVVEAAGRLERFHAGDVSLRA